MPFIKKERANHHKNKTIQILFILSGLTIITLTAGCTSKPHPVNHGSYINQATLQMMEKVNTEIMRISGIKPQFRLVSNPEPNACARLINGDRYIIINSGIMEVIGTNQDEYAYLIAHEFAHFIKHHATEEIEHKKGINKAGDALIAGIECIGMAFGVPLGLLSIFSVDSGTELVALKYDRDQEREADRLAVDYVLAAGYAPQGGVTFHEKLLTRTKEPFFSMLSTHPSEKERISYIRKLIEERAESKKD